MNIWADTEFCIQPWFPPFITVDGAFVLMAR